MTGRFDRAAAVGLAGLIPELDLAALQNQANARCDRLSAEFNAGQFIYQSGGLLLCGLSPCRSIRAIAA